MVFYKVITIRNRISFKYRNVFFYYEKSNCGSVGAYVCIRALRLRKRRQAVPRDLESCAVGARKARTRVSGGRRDGPIPGKVPAGHARGTWRHREDHGSGFRRPSRSRISTCGSGGYAPWMSELYTAPSRHFRQCAKPRRKGPAVRTARTPSPEDRTRRVRGR